MTDKEIQASDEEMEKFKISQDEKCVSARLINLYEAIILGNQMEIEEQKAQIEKMKRCNNCEFEDYEKYHGEKCNYGNYKTCGNWELRK